MEKFRIGTDATMAGHVSKIIERGYAMLDEETRQILPTAFGRALVHGLACIDEDLCSPVIRASIEAGVSAVASGRTPSWQVVQNTMKLFTKKFDAFTPKAHMVLLMLAAATASRDAGRVPVQAEDPWFKAINRISSVCLDALHLSINDGVQAQESSEMVRTFLKQDSAGFIAKAVNVGRGGSDTVNIDDISIEDVRFALEAAGFQEDEFGNSDGLDEWEGKVVDDGNKSMLVCSSMSVEACFDEEEDWRSDSDTLNSKPVQGKVPKDWSLPFESWKEEKVRLPWEVVDLSEVQQKDTTKSEWKVFRPLDDGGLSAVQQKLAESGNEYLDGSDKGSDCSGGFETNPAGFFTPARKKTYRRNHKKKGTREKKMEDSNECEHDGSEFEQRRYFFEGTLLQYSKSVGRNDPPLETGRARWERILMESDPFDGSRRRYLIQDDDRWRSRRQFHSASSENPLTDEEHNMSRSDQRYYYHGQPMLAGFAHPKCMGQHVGRTFWC